jgi:hypothetical protein
MNRAILRLTFSLAVAVALHTGCTTTSTASAPKPGEAAVRQVVAEWIGAMQAKNTEAVLAHYSENFANAAYPNKAAVRDAIEQARVMGMLDGVQGDASALSVSSDAGHVVAGPIRLTGGFGEHVLNLHLQQEAGELRIVSAVDVAVNAPAAL